MPIIPRYSQGKCEERRGLDYIGTEHILLGLVRDRESVGPRSRSRMEPASTT
ncbi:Clp protease N-terminal domain-containing protein [Microbispora sp. H10830]|uniref:Clp protease N-terminal domain-containing protein n=1 Tax=Microbispora sp. H10830 TaxID=2729109 RepID=UPI001601CC14